MNTETTAEHLGSSPSLMRRTSIFGKQRRSGRWCDAVCGYAARLAQLLRSICTAAEVSGGWRAQESREARGRGRVTLCVVWGGWRVHVSSSWEGEGAVGRALIES